MATDIVPRSLENQKSWLDNLKTGITTDGATCGRTAAQVTDDTAFIDSMLTPVTDALDKQLAAMEAEGLARSSMTVNNDKLRKLIKNYKSSPGWNEGMAEAWAVKSTTPQYDMDTQAPTIAVANIGGQTFIRGKKPGFTSVSIDMRVAGTANWTTIGVKLSRFPFIDTTAPETPGKPEAREYRARGYVADQEAGQPSEIVSGIYKG